jgi:hexosaminidase
LDWNGFLARLPDQMNRYKMLGIRAYGGQSAAAGEPHLQRSSHELRSCTDGILLSLEDDAPSSGERATFLVDITNPCWIYRAADLSHVTGIDVAVGQLPFEFQLGHDVHIPKLSPPQTPAGELEVRLDGCDGERIAVLPLQPAVANNAVTALPQAKIAHRDGTHDLCMKFTQRSHDPMWVLDWVRLLE